MGTQSLAHTYLYLILTVLGVVFTQFLLTGTFFSPQRHFPAKMLSPPGSSLFVSCGGPSFVFTDSSDKYRCHALLNSGRWIDSQHTVWQPEGCMLHSFTPDDVSMCTKDRRLLFIGDSTVRLAYYAAAQIIDPSVQTYAEKHSDRSFTLRDNIKLDFIWDPFLNRSETLSLFQPANLDSPSQSEKPPSMLVLGSGLWYLRSYPPEIAMSNWVLSMNRLFDSIDSAPGTVADQTIILPVEQVVESKLNDDRRASLRSQDIDAMNSDMDDRLARRKLASSSRSPSSSTSSITSRFASSPNPAWGSLPDIVSIPRVFNDIARSSSLETEDGMHFSPTISRLQANILYNLRCSDFLLKSFPFDKTCCSKYPPPNNVQIFFLALFLFVFPLAFQLTYAGISSSRFFPRKETMLSLCIVGLVTSFCFLTDRTSLFSKEHKLYDPIHFGILMIISLIAGLATMSKPSKDLGFLNRDQTDEWKGWMQIAILIYHYLGASKISGIYNPIRVLVAAYLFQTGYGHFFFYYKKGDFGFERIASVLVRLNLLTVALEYMMGTDYLSYYFSPLVSMWFCIIWIIMFVGHRLNKNSFFILFKLLVSALVIGRFFNEEWPLENVFALVNNTFKTKWIAHEWKFRVALDLYIVYGGMLTALVSIKLNELKLTEHPQWPKVRMITLVFSAFTMLTYFVFELNYNKFDYNHYHPYIAFFPVISFCILRNATPYLRSTSSKFFAFIGKCSLETFLLQYHLFIAPDTKGIIMMIPGTTWRPLNFVVTSIVFVFASHMVALATNELTGAFCKSSSPSSPSAPSTMTLNSIPVPTPTSSTSTTSTSNDLKEISLASPSPTKSESSIRRFLFGAGNSNYNLPSPSSTNSVSPTTTYAPLNSLSSSASASTYYQHHYQESRSKLRWLCNLKFKFALALACLTFLNYIYAADPPRIGHILPTH